MARIQMYTTSWCGYFMRAKTLLDARGIAYEELDLDDDDPVRQKLHDSPGWTVPQISSTAVQSAATPSCGASTDGRLAELLPAA